jgi:hypothetical protein
MLNGALKDLNKNRDFTDIIAVVPKLK